jgi:ADP-ribose pyrophosphatase YjhB (NUDIX family)
VRFVRRILWYFRPKFTVGAIVLVTDADGRVLLVRQRFVGTWGIPGGFQSPRETAEEAVLRELAEETGLADVEDLSLVARYQQDGRPHLDSLFRARVRASAPDVAPVGVMARLEVDGAGWFALDDPSERPARLRWETELALQHLA